MGKDTDVTADAFSQAVGALFDLRQVGVDWTSVASAVLAFREEERQRALDARDWPHLSPDDDRGAPESVRREMQAGGDANAILVEIHSALLRSLLRVSRDWQRLLQDSSPALKSVADAYQADPDPPHAVVAGLVDQVVVFTQVVGEFLRDQGAQLERDLLLLGREVLGQPRDEPRRREPLDSDGPAPAFRRLSDLKR